MPLYEYKCENGHTTEKLRSVENRVIPVQCGHCNLFAYKQPFSRSNFMFTGFLRDDFWDDWEKSTPGDYQELRGDTPKYGVGI